MYSDDPCQASRNYINSLDISSQIDVLVEEQIYREFQQQQDDQVVKFLKKRHELIALDIDFVKTHVDYTQFKK